jgi:hypothetical protein
MLRRALYAALATGVLPSSFPEFVAAYQIEVESGGRALTGDAASAEIQQWESDFFRSESWMSAELAARRREVIGRALRIGDALLALKQEAALRRPGETLVPGLNCPWLPDAARLFLGRRRS